jgi:hypothetical protein
MMARGRRILRIAPVPVALVIAVLMAAAALAAPAFAQMSTTSPMPPTPPGAAGGTTAPTYSDATMAEAGHALRDVLTINQSYRNKMAATRDGPTWDQ